MDTSKNYYMQDVKNLSVWCFALKHGVLRLGLEAILAAWLVLLLRKAELTELEFILPLIICPVICFLYAMLVWSIKHNQPLE